METSDKKVGKIFLVFAGFCIVALPLVVISAFSFQPKEMGTPAVGTQSLDFDEKGKTIFINYDQLSKEYLAGTSTARTLDEYYTLRQYPGSPPFIPHKVEEADLALALGPDQREAISLAALLHARAGDIDRSMAIIDQGLDTVSEADREALRQSRVSILAEVGERERGLVELEALVADYPDTLSYQMALAELYLGLGRSEAAEALILDLVARDPDNAEWRIRLAQILARQERAGDAEASLLQAVAQHV